MDGNGGEMVWIREVWGEEHSIFHGNGLHSGRRCFARRIWPLARIDVGNIRLRTR